MRIGADNFLPVQLEDEPKHTVCGRMLGSEINGVVPDAPFLGCAFAIGAHFAELFGCVRIGFGILGIDGYKVCASVCRWVVGCGGIPATVAMVCYQGQFAGNGARYITGPAEGWGVKMNTFSCSRS